MLEKSVKIRNIHIKKHSPSSSPFTIIPHHHQHNHHHHHHHHHRHHPQRRRESQCTLVVNSLLGNTRAGSSLGRTLLWNNVHSVCGTLQRSHDEPWPANRGKVIPHACDIYGNSTAPQGFVTEAHVLRARGGAGWCE